jgi:hypothetical protein
VTGESATLVIDKSDINSSLRRLIMDVNRKKSSIKFRLGGTADGRTSISEIKLNSKGNLYYSSNYEPIPMNRHYAFEERLQICVAEEPDQFLTNLIAEIKSINDGNKIFAEFNNDDPIITNDFDHHNVNSVVLSLLRIHYGHSIIDSFDALKNKEFNNTIGAHISGTFCNWTQRFFEEKGGVRQGHIRVNNNMIKLGDRYIVRFTDSTLYFYLNRKSFETSSTNAMKGYFFCYDSEEILDHLKIFKWDRIQLSRKQETIMDGICPRSFINKFTKLLAYANYFENWDEIIAKAFDVKNNTKKKDYVMNFVSMINHFMNYDLSI